MHPRIHAGNSRQGHLTHLPWLSAGAPIDPAGPWCEGPLWALEAGPPSLKGPYRPTICSLLESRLLHTQFMPTIPQSQGEVIGFDLYAGWFGEKKKNSHKLLSRPLAFISYSFANILYLSICKQHLPWQFTRTKRFEWREGELSKEKAQRTRLGGGKVFSYKWIWVTICVWSCRSPLLL